MYSIYSYSLCLHGKFSAFLNEGNYSLITEDGNKKQVGTIPSELGQLVSWKHVVFGEDILLEIIKFPVGICTQ